MSTNAGVLSRSAKQYRRRKPQYTPYYQCVEDYKKRLKQESIARKLKISKYKVYRTLKEARRLGIIKIRIENRKEKIREYK